ncbi:MAG: threonine--tRNA ligase [Acidimicrobiales bacterium]
MTYPDHRRLGRQLRIFASDELCGAGLPLWLPAGAAVRGELERFVVDLERRHGYQHVYTPELAKQELYERSDHWAHYRDDMYPPMQVGAEQVVLRPMNCPHHILVYAAEPRTMRDMPVRLAELGTMFRFERSGVVGGLSRVRQMTLNDGHVFCAPGDVRAEVTAILGLVEKAYEALAIPAPSYRLSLRGPGSKYVGDPAVWAKSEAVLRTSLDDLGVAYCEAQGEAAFYGPKIDLQVTDPRGREETLSTVQVDFHLPERFALSYQDGPVSVRPVMIHRSIVSTMERMVAHLLEVHDGALPVWLAPSQVVIMPVVTDAVDHARRLREALQTEAIRAELDDRDATLGSRVRDAQQRRVPYLAVVGRREVEDGTVAVRLRGGEQLGTLSTEAFVALVSEVARRRLPSLTAAMAVAVAP